MNKEHVPIDSKDDSTHYRQQVWSAVSQRVGSDLTPIASDATFSGTWEVAFDVFGTLQPAFVYTFRGSTLEVTTLMSATPSTESSAYTVKGPGQLNVSGETMHAAMTNDKRLVLFNGDQSLVLVATRRPE